MPFYVSLPWSGYSGALRIFYGHCIKEWDMTGYGCPLVSMVYNGPKMHVHAGNTTHKTLLYKYRSEQASSLEEGPLHWIILEDDHSARAHRMSSPRARHVDCSACLFRFTTNFIASRSANDVYIKSCSWIQLLTTNTYRGYLLQPLHTYQKVPLLPHKLDAVYMHQEVTTFVYNSNVLIGWSINYTAHTLSL